MVRDSLMETKYWYIFRDIKALVQPETGTFDCALRGGTPFDKEYIPLDPVHSGNPPPVGRQFLSLIV